MKKQEKVIQKGLIPKTGFRRTLGLIGLNWELYLMVIPVLAYYIIFHYWPMYGALMAFERYNPTFGILGSEWIGLENFKTFFTTPYFGRLLKNTLTVSITSLLFGFPAPILLALLINEVRSRKFAKTVQTITYMPHFISLVIVCAIIRDFTSNTGIITEFATIFGYDGKTMLGKPGLFVPIYVISGIWQEIGWGSIIYLATLGSIDAQLYEAAEIDGAGKLKQLIHVTIPGLLPTIIILFIMRVGSLLSVGYEKVLLLYNAGIYETADIFSTYTYRVGLIDSNFGLSTAVSFFNSVVNIILLVTTNKICDKLNGTSLF